MTINRQCPFCRERIFRIQKISNDNLYWLICYRNDTSRMYVEYVEGRYRQVSVNKHPEPRTRPMKSVEKSQFDKLQIPYWKLMGQKAKEKDIQYEKMLKSKGMTYGDAVLERSRHGQHQSSLPQFEKYRNENR